jgi:hypothetical protein
VSLRPIEANAKAALIYYFRDSSGGATISLATASGGFRLQASDFGLKCEAVENVIAATHRST